MASERSPNIWIVMPVLNRLKNTTEFVQQLEMQTFTHWKLIVVDDGSKQDTQAYLRQLTQRNPGRYFNLRGDGSWWWAHSLNQGIRTALPLSQEGDFLLTANNDVSFRPDYLQVLLHSASQGSRSIVGSPSCEGTGSPSSFGFKLNPVRGGIYPLLEMAEPDALSTRGTLFPIEVFRTVGLFDETWLPHHGADVDFTFKAKRKGYPLCVAEHALVTHTVQNYKIRPTLRERIVLLFSKRASINLWSNFILAWRFSDSLPKKVLNLLRLLKSSFHFVLKTWR